MSVFHNIDERFTSSNSVPVSQARITAEEWRQIKAERDQLRAEVERLRTRLEVLPQSPEWDGIACRDETIRILDQERDQLRSMCRAAAAEIGRQWPAHCDEEGYGPVNLMDRLEGVRVPDWYTVDSRVPDDPNLQDVGGE